MNRTIAMVGLLALVGTVWGCGGSGGGGGAEAPSVPPLTRDFGDTVYELVTADTAIEEVTRILLYSDGAEARVVILRAGELERSGSARLHGRVLDDATVEITQGRVNLDADGTFSNNDLVPAEGFVLATGDEVQTTGIHVGMLFTLDYDFRAVLAGTRPFADAAALLFD